MTNAVVRDNVVCIYSKGYGSLFSYIRQSNERVLCSLDNSINNGQLNIKI